MFKKAIAGVLSAVMCASALLYDAPFGSRNTAQEEGQVPAAAQPETGLTGKNDLARYLTKQNGTQADAASEGARPLTASAADAVFAVTNLDFDRETGIIRVTSTQSEDAVLRASFIDENSPANVCTVECSVPAGEYVHSTFSADPALLPEYFTVSVQLIGRAGLPLCRAFELKTYTSSVQEIIQKDTSDFAAEQVINLDDDETTNFIVLSEDTVCAETTAESNVLVSADYDQNIYVFDHIDESIRSLTEGQYFYIQPTDTDIISTDIREIVIDGDTATITGTGEIDDMFDFIKIEIDTEQTVVTDDVPEADPAQDAEDEAVSESSRSYLGVRAQTIDNEDDYQKKIEDVQALDRDIEISEVKRTDSLKREFKKGLFSVTPSLNLKSTIKWNFYKNFSYVNVFFVTEEKITLEMTFKASASTPKNIEKQDSEVPAGAENNPEYYDLPGVAQNSGDDSQSSSASSDAEDGQEQTELPDGVQNSGEKDNTPKHLIKIPITSVGAADICLFVDIGLTVSVEGNIGAEKSFTKGFVYDSDNGFEKIDFDTSPKLTKFTLKGSITLDIKIGVEASALKGLIVVSAAGGLKVKAETDLTGGDNQTFNPDGSNVFKPDPEQTDPCIHADKTCIKIIISFKVYIEGKLSIGFRFKDKDSLAAKVLGKLKYEKTITYETDEVFGFKFPKYAVFISIDTPSAFRDGGLQIIRVGDDDKIECGHKAYKVTFLIDFRNAPEGTTAELLIDGNTYPLTPASPARLVLYAAPRASSYTYYINVGGQRKISDSFNITNGSKMITHLISWPYVETGTGKPTVGTRAVEEGPAVTTVTHTTTADEELTFDYSDKMPSKEMISRTNEHYELGEHIIGMFSNDGTFTVIGYGDMYTNASISSSVRSLIRRIVFCDQDPEEDLYINNIAKSLFSGAKNLEVIYMPERLREICDSAFNGCTGLKWLRYGDGSDTSETFRLPETLTAIGNSAFYGCSSAAFGDLKIPESVTLIGKFAFDSCPLITSVTIPDSEITELKEHVFQNCTGLKEAYIGTGAVCTDTTYCHWFHGCPAVEKLTLSGFTFGATYNKWHLNDLFSGSASGVPQTLAEVTVTGGTAIPDSYFDGLAYLKHITYPDGLTEIGNSAFSGCSGLIRPELPETLTAIGNSAFNGCTAAEFGDLIIPESVTFIGASAFDSCPLITSVTVPGTNPTELKQHVFQNCTGLKEAFFGPGVTCTDNAYCHWFHSCPALEKLTIPEFVLGTTYTKWNLNDLFNGGNSGVPQTLAEVIVTGGTEIPDSYFAGLSYLKHITFPDGLTTIGSTAFKGCTAAEFGDLQLPESVTFIGASAFESCPLITSVTVPGTTQTELKQHIFQNCTGLKEAFFGPGVICTDATYCHWFHGCTAVERLVLPEFESGTTYNNWHLNDLFGGNSSGVPQTLTEVIVTSGTSVPKDYFSGITALSTVILPGGLVSVQTNAFKDCTALAEAYLIGEDADWDNVDITETGNQPLLDIVRKGKPVVILSDPKDLTVQEGQNAAFTVYAAGKYELSYLWKYSTDGGSNWWAMDCTDRTLSFTASPEQNGYLYRCEVMDVRGNRVNSAEAMLTVNEKPEATVRTVDPKTLPGYKPGDMNGDGSIDVSDAVLLARFAVGDTSATIKDIGVINGDVNGDGNVDTEDVMLILQYIVKKIRVFPVDE